MNQGSKKKVSVSMPPELYEQLEIWQKRIAIPFRAIFGKF